MWSYDLMVFRVYKDRIVQCRARVDDSSIKVQTEATAPADQAPPKYYLLDDGVKVANPMGQLDADAAVIPATNPDGSINYARTATDSPSALAGMTAGGAFDRAGTS